MNTLEDISDVFSTLHDGVMEECEGTYEELWLKVRCTYLTEFIGKDFDYFYLKLLLVKEFYFQEYGGKVQHIYDTIDLAHIDIEMLYSKVESESVTVDCTKGILFLQCNSVEVFDQEKKPVSASALFDIAKLYWSRK